MHVHIVFYFTYLTRKRKGAETLEILDQSSSFWRKFCNGNIGYLQVPSNYGLQENI